MRKLSAYWVEDRTFFLGWIFLQWVLGWVDRLWLGPFGMHQGAQADRAGVAWNFYHETWNLFLPRVMENRAAEGIAGMEFPIISYVVGMLWRLVGHHDIIYRLVIGVLVTLGYWSVWRLLRKLGIVGLGRIAILFLLYLSPVMVFYTWNFLPDPAALGLALAGVYHWYGWRVEENTNTSGIGVWLCFSLAGLIKVSLLIPLLAFIGVEMINSRFYQQLLAGVTRPKVNYRNTEYGETIVIEDADDVRSNNGFLGLKALAWAQGLLVYGGVLVVVAAWYFYSNWLTQSTWNIHFIQQINPVKSLNELVDTLNFIEGVWWESLFFGSAAFWMMFLWFYSLMQKRGDWGIWEYFSVLNFVGFLGFFLLFSKQFRFHDYYFICGWPFIFSALLVIFKTQLWGKAVFVGPMGLLSIFFFVYYPLRGIGNSSKMLTYRLERGHYYCQNIIKDERGLADIGSWLNQRNDPLHSKEVLVIGDASPSTALYYLQRKGIRFAPDFDSVNCRGIWNKRQLLESNVDTDSMRWQWPWDYSHGKRRKLGYVVVENNYIDSLDIYSYIIDIKDDKKIIYSSGNWKLFAISDSKRP